MRKTYFLVEELKNILDGLITGDNTEQAVKNAKKKEFQWPTMERQIMICHQIDRFFQ